MQNYFFFLNFVIAACLQSAGKDRKAYSPLDQADSITVDTEERDNNNRSNTHNKNHSK